MQSAYGDEIGTDTETEPLDGLTEARRRIDEVVDELGEEVSYQQLIAALEASRDTLLVTGRVPDWFGDAASANYREMCWSNY